MTRWQVVLLCVVVGVAGAAGAQEVEVEGASVQVPAPTGSSGGLGIYTWRDTNGQLHVSDQLQDVPDALRADALRRAEAGQSLPAANYTIMPSDAPRPEPPASAPVEASEGSTSADPPDPQTRAYWQERMEKERRRKADAQQRLQEVQSQMVKVRATTPAGFHDTLTSLDAEARALERTIADAEYQILQGLPEEARRLGVPPGWLR